MLQPLYRGGVTQAGGLFDELTGADLVELGGWLSRVMPDAKGVKTEGVFGDGAFFEGVEGALGVLFDGVVIRLVEEEIGVGLVGLDGSLQEFGSFVKVPGFAGGFAEEDECFTGEVVGSRMFFCLSPGGEIERFLGIGADTTSGKISFAEQDHGVGVFGIDAGLKFGDALIHEVLVVPGEAGVEHGAANKSARFLAAPLFGELVITKTGFGIGVLREDDPGFGEFPGFGGEFDLFKDGEDGGRLELAELGDDVSCLKFEVVGPIGIGLDGVE